MASANVTLGNVSREFECDGTERTATLNHKGGKLTNMGENSLDIWINEAAGTVDMTSGNATSVRIGSGGSHVLPPTCSSFTFKANGGSEYLKYTQE